MDAAFSIHRPLIPQLALLKGCCAAVFALVPASGGCGRACAGESLGMLEIQRMGAAANSLNYLFAPQMRLINKESMRTGVSPKNMAHIESHQAIEWKKHRLGDGLFHRGKDTSGQSSTPARANNTELRFCASTGLLRPMSVVLNLGFAQGVLLIDEINAR